MHILVNEESLHVSKAHIFDNRHFFTDNVAEQKDVNAVQIAVSDLKERLEASKTETEEWCDELELGKTEEHVNTINMTCCSSHQNHVPGWFVQPLPGMFHH